MLYCCESGRSAGSMDVMFNLSMSVSEVVCCTARVDGGSESAAAVKGMVMVRAGAETVTSFKFGFVRSVMVGLGDASVGTMVGSSMCGAEMELSFMSMVPVREAYGHVVLTV